MAESKYEKYLIRNAESPDLNVKWGKPELGVIAPFFFLRTSGPIKEANSMIEYAWIVKDSAFGVTPEKSPHKHDSDEFFLFMGSNPQDSTELGGEIEFWMGEGEETEKLKFNTSSLVYVPKGLLHMPIFFKKIKKPLLWVVIAVGIGDTLKKGTKYPPRGV